MSEQDANPIKRKALVQQPGIVGAQWWNEGLDKMSDPVTRRQTLMALLVAGGTVGTLGVVAALADSPAENVEMMDALKMQRQLGWSFGATEDTLAFSPLAAPIPVERLQDLLTQMAPRQDALKPFFQPTLFHSVSGTLGGGAFNLRGNLRSQRTYTMTQAFEQGRTLASLFDEQPQAALATAVLVDLSGPEAVAFAAALAERFEPVFTYDNWPHPLGVVPAHLTLAAVADYQPRLWACAASRPVPAPPVFVLDRQRLAPYTDPEHQFDNRYTARMPTAEQLRALGLQHVLYVMPEGVTQELDDLNEDFVAWSAAGLDVKCVAASDFRPDSGPLSSTVAAGPSAAVDGGTPGPTDAGTAADAGTSPPLHANASVGSTVPPYFFGGSRAVHDSFWLLYPWRPTAVPSRGPRPLPPPPAASGTGRPPDGVLSSRPPVLPPPGFSAGYAYEPSRRPTMFSAVPRGASGDLGRPTNFGKVAMRVGRQSRDLLGPVFASRSSWTRSSSSGGG
jgi:hypothetical protein